MTTATTQGGDHEGSCRLFSTDYGLMSAAVIAITIGMAVFFVRFFVTHMREDERKAADQQ